jgi:lipopolysaccharide/colanic/teichoic acid biosynthesis glycosyltransferase
MSWTVLDRKTVKLYNPHYQFLKRIFDLALCLVAFPIVIPIGIIVVIAIRWDSPGPALFIQERVGRGGKIFKIYKFRTLQHQLDDSGHRAFMKNFVHGEIEKNKGHTVFKPFKKSHVTRIGNILRKTSLDELPQLINVFKGDMSLVGPRPNVTWEVEEYLEWHKERLEVLPGITGLAQVKGRSGLLFDEIVYWDIEYIKHKSLSLDFKILWWTIKDTLISRKGAQ